MYTSGMTGRPKGAVGTNRNIGGHIMNATYAAMAAAAAAPRLRQASHRWPSSAS